VDKIIESTERLKAGLIWVAIFGRSGVGKSSVVNSLVGKDVAEIIDYDRVTVVEQYREAPWLIIDVPGIMGEEVNEALVRTHPHLYGGRRTVRRGDKTL
jgi:predicted GTPase